MNHINIIKVTIITHMRKLLSVSMAAAAFFAASQAQAAEPIVLAGELTAQLDMNMGMLDEPDLLEPETYPVTAAYDEDSGELTFSSFADIDSPITFRLNLATGEAVAEAGQVAYEEEGWVYYYADVATMSDVVYADVMNYGDRTLVSVRPWGTFLKLYYFFSFAYFNTEIVLDGHIPGLQPEAVVPEIEIAAVDYTLDQTMGTYMVFDVEVTSSGLPEDAEIRVYYNDPYFDAAVLQEAVNMGGGSYSFGIAVPEEGMNVAATVNIWAVSGNVSSETYSVTFVPGDANAVGSIGAEEGAVRYYDLGGAEVRNPAAGSVLIRVEGGKASKVMVK